MQKQETSKERSERILSQLKKKYPGKKAFDLDGRGLHFVCELEPTEEHPEYDRALEVIISSQAHQHLKTRQDYTIISGTLELHLEEKNIVLKAGEKYAIEPGEIHWAKSKDECWVEIYSEPGWTKEDHIVIS